MAGLILLIVDISPLHLIYETILDLIKWKTRPLSDKEKEMLLSVFGKTIQYHLISIDPRSIPAIKRKTVAYVSFHTINFDTTISDPTLVHECVHIWQYQHHGAVYISESFWAQRWGGGYNYGGLEPLKMYSEGLGLKAFNFEQQADIIEDYYRWKNNLPMQWAVNVPGMGEMLTKYARQISREQQGAWGREQG
ncbi:MAG: hypothetical protein WBP41_06080 [Saprospiraceae bacterium]